MEAQILKGLRPASTFTGMPGVRTDLKIDPGKNENIMLLLNKRPEQKIFVVDTNVLLHDPTAVSEFGDNCVVLPIYVLEELDKFKNTAGTLGGSARAVIRHLDELRLQGSLHAGVPLKNGGILIVMSGVLSMSSVGLNASLPENKVLRVAFELKQTYKSAVTLVTKDINMRLKADSCNVQARDYEKQIVNINKLFKGWQAVEVEGAVMDMIDESGSCPLKDLHLESAPHPNTFLQLTQKDDPERPMRLVRYKDFDLDIVSKTSKGSLKTWNCEARSPEQQMALDVLLDPGVQLVTLVGQAGTGKTLLALAAALQCVVKRKQYNKILVSRPIMPMGKDIGYLPGSKDEKMANWMLPIFDNLSFLLGNDQPSDMLKTENRFEELGKTEVDSADTMMAAGLLSLEALTYIRGRSLMRQFVIVDEAQNLTPHEIKTVISRAGEGTKVVLTGDPYQIDNPYLDANSNGLTYCVEKLKATKVHGHVTLQKSERSALAAVAAELL